jgi:hypothetical protein
MAALCGRHLISHLLPPWQRYAQLDTNPLRMALDRIGITIEADLGNVTKPIGEVVKVANREQR